MSASFLVHPAVTRVVAAGIPVRCDLAHAAAPIVNSVVGQLEGLAFYMGIPLAIALAAMLVLLSMHRIRGRLAMGVVFVMGALLLLSIIGGVFGTVVQNPC